MNKTQTTSGPCSGKGGIFITYSQCDVIELDVRAIGGREEEVREKDVGKKQRGGPGQAGVNAEQ